MVAMLMTLTVNGGVLWSFDNVAKNETTAQDKVTVTLETVNIVALRSGWESSGLYVAPLAQSPMMTDIHLLLKSLAIRRVIRLCCH